MQDLTAQKTILDNLGVNKDRIYTDEGLSGRNRKNRPGLEKALAATTLKGLSVVLGWEHYAIKN